MTATEITCQIRVVTPDDHNTRIGQSENSRIIDLRDCAEVGTDIRDQWVTQVVRLVETPTFHNAIRPWDILAKLDGSIERLTPLSSPEDGERLLYPARFRIPPSTISDLGHREQVIRAERFAMACLIYEIDSKTKPFEKLTDIEVQKHFCNAEFPDDAFGLPHSILIACGWSEEFLDEMERKDQAQTPTFLQQLGNQARAHPILTVILVGGTVVATGSFLASSLLGVAGFTAVGPAAGSAAAAWQSSIGAVKAGSLFAWFQSAAMGGAAMGTIKVAGIAGVGAASAAGATMVKVADIPGLAETFRRVYRRGTS